MLAKFTFGELLEEVLALLGRHMRLLLALLLAMTLGFTLLDLISERVASIVVSLANVFIGYILLEQLLVDRMSADLTGRRFGSMFGVSILSGLGIIVGLVFLIVPGLYLAARWTLAPAHVVAEHRQATDALAASWDATRESVIPLMVVYFIELLVSFGMIGGIVAASEQSGAYVPDLVELFLTNLITAGISIGGWLVTAAAYRLATDPAASLDSVFG